MRTAKAHENPPVMIMRKTKKRYMSDCISERTMASTPTDLKYVRKGTVRVKVTITTMAYRQPAEGHGSGVWASGQHGRRVVNTRTEVSMQ